MAVQQKRHGSAGNRHLRTPICTSLAACDGANLTLERIETGICGKCAKAAAKKDKSKEPKGLKGEKVLR
jgi:hypothetical protein